MLVHCAHLKYLHLNAKLDLEIVLQGLRDTTVVSLLRTCFCTIESSGLRIVANIMPFLESLRLEGVDIQDSDIDYFVSRCHQLKFLHLDGFYLLTDASLVCIGHHLTRLHFISLAHNPQVTDAGVIALALCCPCLYCVWFTQLNITDVGLQTLGSSCRMISNLSVQDCIALTDQAFATFNSLTMESLLVNNTQVRGKFVEYTFRYATCTWCSVICDNCPLLDESFVDAVALCVNVQICDISMKGCPLSKSALLRLYQCLPLSLIQVDLSEGRHVDEEVVRSFMQHQPNLKIFQLKGCGFTRELVKEFSCLRV
jgi:hypothetical protein